MKTYRRTFAVLQISAAAFDEIYASLKSAGYEHCFVRDGEKSLIDMNSLALQRAPVAPENPR